MIMYDDGFTTEENNTKIKNTIFHSNATLVKTPEFEDLKVLIFSSNLNI